MATSTIKTYLMYKPSTSYTKLCDIKDYPDLIGAPEALETTTLSNTARTFIEGLQANEQLSFTANYDPSDFDTLAGLKGEEQDLAVDFGEIVSPATLPSEGRFTFKGFVSVSIVGKGVNEVREMTITVTPTTEIEKASA